MQRILPMVTILTLLLGGNVAHAQKTLLKTDGWGSISGKVTLDGELPAIVDLVPKMMLHPDKACCLAPAAKPIEKVDSMWIVDPKTKAVANVIVWIAPPKGTYFPMHASYLKRKDHVVIDQPHCAFLPRISAANVAYFDGKDMVATGQKVIVKNSAVVAHNVRIVGTKTENGLNKVLPPKTELEPDLVPEKLPVTVQCDIHTWMGARLFLSDHPYYAITDAKGEFTIPFVPAGAEISVIAWHEAIGYVSRPDAKKVTLQNKTITTVDFSMTK